ncbi:MAG: hypothetical protein AAF125_00935, partial [Chloroflexota bacterium]
MRRRYLLGLLLLLLAVAPASAQVSPLPPSYIRADRLGFTFVAYLNNLGNDADTRYRKALEMGAGWTRWPLYWNATEVSPGVFNWSGYDALVEADRANGFDTNVILLGMPGFYGNTANIQGLREPVFADGTDVPAFGKPINPGNPWARFVYEAVNRYRPGGVLAQELGWPPGAGIRVWEAWNEPDLELFWNGTPEGYARLLKVAYLAAKSADNSAQVMYGGLAYGNPDTNDYLRATLDIYRQDPAAPQYNYYMDIVGLHSYATARRTGQVVARVNETLVAYGLNKPIWVNETGVSVWDDYPGPTGSANNPSERRWRGTMEQQAAFVMQSAVYAFASGAEKVFFHQLYDDCGDSGGDFAPGSGSGDAFGFYRNPSSYGCFSQHPQPGSARPSVESFSTLARLVGNANLTTRRVLRRGDGSVFVQLGLGGDERLTFLWNELASESTISWRAESTSARFYGYGDIRFTLTPAEGQYTVTLPPARLNDDPQRPVGTNVMIGGRTFAMLEQVIPDAGTGELLAGVPQPFTQATPRAPLPAQIGSVLGNGQTGTGTLDNLSDLTPPITGMTALPEISQRTFTVSWNGADTGGIERYLVWVQVDDGEWTPW